MTKQLHPSTSFKLLYFSYFLSCFNDQLWAFAMIFMLEHLGSLRLIGVSQLVENTLQMMASAFIGGWMNKHSRIYATLSVLALNNLAVTLSASLLITCMLIVDDHPSLYIACLVLSILFGAVSKCASEGEEMAFTKDWIVVMTEKEGTDALSSFILCNVVSWFVERQMFIIIYDNVPELRAKHKRTPSMQKRRQEEEKELLKLAVGHNEVESSWFKDVGRIFWKQSIYPAAIGLALMYFTVLGFDGIPISYGKANGLPDDMLGLFKGAASLLGIIGAIVYTQMEQKIGLRKTGLVGMTIQQISNVFCVFSLFAAGSLFTPNEYWSSFSTTEWLANFRSTFAIERAAKPVINGTEVIETSEFLSGVDWSTFKVNGHPMYSIFLFFFGVTIARVGVWIADLSITQLMQENVLETERLTVFGVHTAICQFFSLCKDVLVILFPDSRIFGAFVLLSVMTVMVAYLHYLYYMWRTKNTDFESVAADTTDFKELNLPELLFNLEVAKN
ncbi:unnamed protein product [Bursaphelenchus okinawaensis]|uniref:Solute carrier family 40 member n=1 Tax=Bursaphelenchus okinawaensis TaxID=465554 RepID=A0A811K9Q7_9BILA|nr:unnamed protein product [Bursaphelenchus okinawaensis]CAG9096238.1 unnamed protein product [Bursaphelenchus okinawaensis]